MRKFGLDIWGDNNFVIKEDTVNVNHGLQPSLLEITQAVTVDDMAGDLVGIIIKNLATQLAGINVQGRIRLQDQPLHIDDFIQALRLILETRR